MRTVPSRRENKKCTARAVEKKKGTVPSRRGRSYIPPCPVVKTYMHRPVRSSENIYIYRPAPARQFLFTVPSRRDNYYLPSRPVVKQRGYCSVPSRPVEKIHTHRPVPSHLGIQSFFVLPSRPVSNITSHEKP